MIGVYNFAKIGIRIQNSQSVPQNRATPEQKAHIAERAGEWFRKRLDETNNQLKQ